MTPSPHITKRFSLGEIVATGGLLAGLEKSGQPPLLFLVRHAIGDWGEVSAPQRSDKKRCSHRRQYGPCLSSTRFRLFK